MSFSKIKSHAKINLALNILGKKRFLHKIETIIAFVSLHDDILIKKIKSNQHEISFCGKFSNNIAQNNTVFKLLKILDKKKLLKNTKFKIKIKKRIPIKSGLGGGSMNAASILDYLVKKNIIKISNNEITKICNLIGSDVLLGLKFTNSILMSNNKIKRYYNCEKFYTLIVKPNFGCSTKEIYKKVKNYNKPKFNKPTKKMFDFNFLRENINCLEPIAFSKYSKLKSIKLHLENSFKPVFVRMTGSGSAIVAYYRTKASCKSAKKMFNQKYKNYWCIASKTI